MSASTKKRPWWEADVSEELTIVALAVMALGAMTILGAEAKEAISAIGGGLVGYLAKGKKEP